MTPTEAGLILLSVLALWLTLTRGALVYHPALPTRRRPGGRRPFRPQTLAACPLFRMPAPVTPAGRDCND